MRITSEDLQGILNEQGRKLWDKAVDLCAQAAESVEVEDRNPALVRDEIASKIRRLSFEVSPPSPTSSDPGEPK